VNARIRFCRWFAFLACAVAAAAGPPRTPADFFGLARIWDVRLALSADDWQSMEPVESARDGGPRPDQPPGGKREYPWAKARFECEGVVLSNVAVRFKGNSSFMMSRRGLKRPFRIDFDRDAPGRAFAGLGGLMLGNNANDPSQMHEALAYAAFARAGVPAPRTAFVRLHLEVPGIADGYVGLYTAVEPVDGRFLKARFGSHDGLLAKPERMPGPRYFGEDWETYAERFEVKRAGNKADRRRLIDFARLADRAPETEFAERLGSFVDVGELSRFVAVNAWLANMDSLLGTGHNHYLHVAPDGRVRFIPWDLNEAFGGHPGAGPASQQLGFDVLHPHAPSIRFLDRFLAHPDFARRYRDELTRLATNALSSDRFLSDARSVAAAIGPAVEDESKLARANFHRNAPGETNAAVRGPRLGGPGGPVPPPFATVPLPDWIRGREREVAAQLAGEKTGTRPRVGGPGRPGGPGMGGPGGPRPRSPQRLGPPPF